MNDSPAYNLIKWFIDNYDRHNDKAPALDQYTAVGRTTVRIRPEF